MMQDYPRIKELAGKNRKAANEMLTALAAGAFSAADLTGLGAFDRARDALEYILTETEVEAPEIPCSTDGTILDETDDGH